MIIAKMPLPEFGERIAARTLVQRPYDAEVRNLTRPPVQFIKYRWHYKSKSQFDAVRKDIRADPLGLWDVPWWRDAEPATVISTDTTVSVSDTSEYIAGGKALIWQADDFYALVTIDSISTGQITLTGAVGSNLTGYVMPVYPGYARDGYQLTKRWVREISLWSIEVEFEIDRDLPSAAPIQIMLSLDISGSMDDEVSPGVTRLDVAKINLTSALDALENSGVILDVYLLGWSGSQDKPLIKRSAVAADYDALRAYLDTFTGSGGTPYNFGFDGAAAFFDGSVPRVMVFVTDGYADPESSIAWAVSIRDGIAGLNVHAVSIGSTDTSDIDLIDNTGGGDLVADDDEYALAGLIRTILRTTSPLPTTYLSFPVYEPGGFVLQSLEADIVQSAELIDSGVGQAVQVQTYSGLDEGWEVQFTATTAAMRQQDRLLWYYLAGRWLSFWVPETKLEIVSSTTTSINITPIFEDVTDNIGLHLSFGGEYREVTSASEVGDDHQLNFAAATAPSDAWFIRLVRGALDALEIEHYLFFYQRARMAVLNDVV